MSMEEYFRALETYVESRKLDLGDGESVISLLYEAYGDINRMYDDQIKADFGLQVGIRLAQEIQRIE